MSKEEKKAKKLEKKEAKAAKKEAKAEKSLAKAQAKADKKHAKAYKSFVKDTEKKNKKAQKKAAKSGQDFVPIAILPIDEFQSKSEIKAEKAMQKAYGKYVKKLEKKNAKAEKKCAKKGKPFVPVAIPTYEEYATSAVSDHKGRNVVLMIVLILLIWFLVYFMVMYSQFVYTRDTEPVDDSTKVVAEYESYSNPHEITTTPDYSIADAKIYLQQTLHDNWNDLGYSSDPSSNAISYNNRIVNVNGADCYMFTAGGKTFAVSVKLSACYYAHNGEYTPITFNNTDILFGE